MKKTNRQVHPDPCPDLLVELGPENKGVGSWVPHDKHRLVAHYLDATQHAWKKWPKRVLIDPFCGPGRIQVKGESGTRDGGALVAWRQMDENQVPFTHCLVGDLAEERARACESRLRAVGATVTAFPGPAAETVSRMLSHVPRDALTFAYVDPYNLEYLSYPMLAQLASLKNVDLAVHFSTMDLTRNVDHELDPARARFDEVAPGWRDQPMASRASKASLADEFFRYWVELIRGLGFTAAKAMPLITNDSNNGLYRMVFFARDKFPLKIWDDVAKDATRDLFA